MAGGPACCSGLPKAHRHRLIQGLAPRAVLREAHGSRSGELVHSADRITSAPQAPGRAEVGRWLLWMALHLMHELLGVLENLSRKHPSPKFIRRETLKAKAPIQFEGSKGFSKSDIPKVSGDLNPKTLNVDHSCSSQFPGASGLSSECPSRFVMRNRRG